MNELHFWGFASGNTPRLHQNVSKTTRTNFLCFFFKNRPSNKFTPRVIGWNTIPHEKLRLTVHHKKLTLVSHGSFATLASILTCQVNMMYKSVKVMASGDQMPDAFYIFFTWCPIYRKKHNASPAMERNVSCFIYAVSNNENTAVEASMWNSNVYLHNKFKPPQCCGKGFCVIFMVIGLSLRKFDVHEKFTDSY